MQLGLRTIHRIEKGSVLDMGGRKVEVGALVLEELEDHSHRLTLKDTEGNAISFFAFTERLHPENVK